VQSLSLVPRTLLASTLALSAAVSLQGVPASFAAGDAVARATATPARDDVPVRGLLTSAVDPAPAGADAIRVSVLGDGSGGVLQVRILTGAEDGVLTGYRAAPPVTIDFKGWKTLVLPLAQFAYHSDNNPDTDSPAAADTPASPTAIQFALTAASARLYFNDLAWTTASAAPTDVPLGVIDTFATPADVAAHWKASGDYNQIRSVEFGGNRNANFIKSGPGSLSFTVRSPGENESQLRDPVLMARLRKTPKQPYVVYARPPFETISPDSAPSVAEILPTPAISLFAAPGQTEPATFSVYSATTLKNATASLTGSLVSKTGGKIPASAIALHIVRPALVADGPELLMKDDRQPLTGPLPSVRLTGDPVTTISPGSSKQFWVTVQTPQGQAAGTYTGKIVFQAPGVKPTGIALNVEIVPVTLRTAHYQYGVDLPSVLSTEGAAPGEQSVTPEMLAAQLADIRSHGVKMVVLHDKPASLSNALQLYKASGLSPVGPVVVAAPMSSPADFAAVEALRAPLGLTEAFDIYFRLPADQAKSPDAARTYGQQARDADKNTLVVATVPSDNAYSGLAGGMGDALAPLYTLSSDHAEKLMAEGHRVTPNRDWWTWNIGGNDPIRNRLYAGFLLFKTGNGLYGAFPGPYQSYTGDPYAIFNSGSSADAATSRMATFPVEGGVLDTVQWEAVHSGIDDIRYTDALKTISRELKDARVGKSQTDLADSYLIGIAKKPMLPLTPAQVQSIRRSIATQTIKLQQLLKKSGHGE
jgi:hypothetical protein